MNILNQTMVLLVAVVLAWYLVQVVHYTWVLGGAVALVLFLPFAIAYTEGK